MRILYIHQHFTTRAGSSGTRSYEFARRWVEAGHTVQIVCGNSGDAALPANNQITIDGIQVRTTGIGYDNTMGFVRRLASFAVFAVRSSRRACRSDADVVLATSTPLTVAVPALVAKLLAGRRLVFEVRDVWPDAAIDAGVLKSPLLVGLARLLERAAYQHADHIVALSTGMRDRILGKGEYAHKLDVIPNCSDLDLFASGAARREGDRLREQTSTRDKLVVLYLGAISRANDPDFMVGLAHLMRDDPGIELWFVGAGNRYDYVRDRVRDSGAQNVRFFGARPKCEVPGFAAAADVGLVTFISQPVYFENSPNKFFDYVAAGLPVVFNRDTWLGPYLEHYNAGWCGRKGHPEDVATHLRRLHDDRDLMRRMGTAARRMAEQEFSRDALAAGYLRLLERVAGGGQA